MTPSPAPRSRRLPALARILLALGILAWVGKSLPWEDELSFQPAGGEKLVLHGHIDGPWNGDTVSFVPDDRAALDERWPLGERERARNGQPIVARRRAANDDGGFDW